MTIRFDIEKTLILFFFVTMAIMPCMIAQQPNENGEVAFAFVQTQHRANSAKAAPGALASESPKFRTAKKIFENIVRARGDLRQQAPDFVMSRRENYVAWMDPLKVQIGLEEKAYNVCTAFGPDSLNALAALLAHEITHYYEKHDWKRHFVSQQNGSGLGKRLDDADEGIEHETQADYLGGFLAISAGYAVHGVMPRLLDSLYKAYNLGDTIPGYPSLQERKTMSENVQSKLQDLQNAFEISNLLTHLEAFRDAAAYHRFILKDYQSREIYNNAGVLSMLRALPLATSPGARFCFPLELDPISRIGGHRRSPEKASVAELLLEAENYFNKAKELDPSYAPAFVNLGCAQALVGNWDDAEFYARKAQKTASQNAGIQADAFILLGIVAAGRGDSLTARQHFEKAKSAGNPFAASNLDLLVGKRPWPDPPGGGTDNRQPAERIDSLSLALVAANPVVDKVVEIEAGRTNFGVRTMPHSTLFVHIGERGRETHVLQVTAKNYPGKTQRGIGIGAPASEVERLYGPPSRRIRTTEGYVWVYFPSDIAFRIDEKQETAGWFTFLLQK